MRAEVPDRAGPAAPAAGRRERPVVVTGGSGFIGSNLADALARDGEDVIVLDDCSRPGVVENLAWLRAGHSERVRPFLADVRDFETIAPVIAEAKAVFHLAAQTAVTTSLARPVEDFEVNARGTLNVLEAIRLAGRPIPVVFASTNKVYGALGDIDLVEREDRYEPTDPAIARHGIGETRPLAFCTPYGCSKGVADQYVLDYAASFGIPAAVLRMSCIYGPRQFGTEDQGWVAHFLIAALEGRSINIYGDGKQVRDILHVSDAVAAYRAVLAGIDRLSGRAFNLGGGVANAVSLRTVLAEIRRLVNEEPRIVPGAVRQGDQRYFVADTRFIESSTGWRARVSWQEGLADLAAWLRAERGLGAMAERATA